MVAGFGAQAAFRSYRAASRQARLLTGYLEEEAAQLEELALRLEQRSDLLQRGLADLIPKIQWVVAFLEKPLVAPAVPWILRRLLGVKFRKRG